MPKLILVRHGQSQWNLENRFTGWWDVDLTDKGVAEAKAAGALMKEKGVWPTTCFTSFQTRAIKTLNLALEEMGRLWLPVTKDWRLNERHYGGLTGLNKQETRDKHGDEQVHIWRRSFDVPPPGGESLKDTAARTLPYYEAESVPQLKAGKTVLVAAHGNSLRSIVMDIEGLSPEEIVKREIATGEPVIYRIGADGGLEERVAI